jgi:hypothetical protein
VEPEVFNEENVGPEQDIDGNTCSFVFSGLFIG